MSAPRPTPSSVRRSRTLAGAAASLGLGLLGLASCDPSTVVQVGPDDVVAVRVTPDSADLAIGRSLQLRVLPLDATDALVVGLPAEWTTLDGSIASVDGDGVVTGLATGTAEVQGSVAGMTATAVVEVAPAPEIALSDDSLGFTAVAGGGAPPPDSVEVTNAGVFPLVGLAVDSIAFDTGATDWLAAGFGSATAPTWLGLTPSTAGVTASGTYTAHVWISGADADNSPTSVLAVLEVEAGAAASVTVDDGDGQTAEAGAAVATAPSVLVTDAFDNPVEGVAVTFAVTGGGGSVTGASATTNASGVARVGSWTLGTVVGPNGLSATVVGLPPVAFTATGAAGAATTLAVSAGDNQSAVAGSAVAIAPAVLATDQFGNAVADVPITFEVVGGGGSVAGATSTTGPDGVTTVGSWTLGTTAGTNTLRAISGAVADTATFTATGLSGEATNMLLVAGDAQTDTVAATLPVAYSVRIVDINGNGVAGIPVSWSVTGGGGSIPASSTTDADGLATGVRVLGTAVGTHTAEAAVGGLDGSPVGFTATAVAGTAAQIVPLAGDAQSATVNTQVGTPPQAAVQDMFGNPIDGHSVTFAVTAGGGSVSPTTAITTGPDGTAAATSWTLGTVAGVDNNTVTATAAGIAATAPFDATATADVPASVQVFSGNNQTAVTETAVASAPTVEVEDQHGNPVPGVSVSFTASESGSVGTANASTDANGRASTSWTVSVTGHTVANDGTFANTLTAAVTGLTDATFTGFARYSYGVHVNPLFSACQGCHGGATPFAGLALDGSAAADYTNLVDVSPNCDATLASVYRRVSSAGGPNAANDYSILLRLVDGSIPTLGTCGDSGHPTPLDDGQLAIVHAWIRNGAPNN